jgi:hypothetical protein
VQTYGEAMDSADKATNKAMSAAYKYAAFLAFCIPTEGDNDADATTPEPAARPQTMTRPVTQPQPQAAPESHGRARGRRRWGEGCRRQGRQGRQQRQGAVDAATS